MQRAAFPSSVLVVDDEPVVLDLFQRVLGEKGFSIRTAKNAERQLERCRDIAHARGLPIGLYLDTAVGVDPAGADAWMEPGMVLRGLSIGAPRRLGGCGLSRGC